MLNETCPVILRHSPNASKSLSAVDAVVKKFNKLDTYFTNLTDSKDIRRTYADGINCDGKKLSFLPNVKFTKAIEITRELIDTLIEYQTTDEYREIPVKQNILAEGEFVFNQYVLRMSVNLKFYAANIYLNYSYGTYTEIDYEEPACRFKKGSIEAINEILNSGFYKDLGKLVADLNFKLRPIVYHGDDREIITTDSESCETLPF